MRNRRRKVLKSSQARGHFEGFGMATLKINCPTCGARMHNRKTTWLTPIFARQYFTCSNVECSETSVYELTRQHVISPSGLSESGLIKTLLDRLRPEDKQLALELLQAQAG
ncbi:ogr/Delta-like zinc finger family protein [Serratia ureilytica]|nr:ogr/Delta-like zinc finger family protein [Serratia ureilytica]